MNDLQKMREFSGCSYKNHSEFFFLYYKNPGEFSPGFEICFDFEVGYVLLLAQSGALEVVEGVEIGLLVEHVAQAVAGVGDDEEALIL